ncbi:MAG: hypothetical protein QOC75_2170, partial [Pseudonocardiales bacterium]|nr:hypothetical protein [Pseudonocardiales bacterium]
NTRHVQRAGGLATPFGETPMNARTEFDRKLHVGARQHYLRPVHIIRRVHC